MSNQLTPAQIESFLARYKDPADARRFLQEAGLIDENGELAEPYRPERIEVSAEGFAALQRRLAQAGGYDPRVAKVLSTPAPWEKKPMDALRQASADVSGVELRPDWAHNDSLQANPPAWLDEDEVSTLPDAFTDKRELWEMVATCTPGACISAHYSSLTLRVVADWLERRMEQADVNGWDYEPWQLIHDLRLAAVTADTAIEMDSALPRTIKELLISS